LLKLLRRIGPPFTPGDRRAVASGPTNRTRRHTDAIIDSVTELADLGLVRSATAQVRVHGSVPMFKLYILNHAEAFFGFYPIAEHEVTLAGQPVRMFDLMGKDATMFHHEAGG
jgi:hypothetical protein